MLSNERAPHKKLLKMELGKYNKLTINRAVDFGLYLVDADGNEVLLPKRYLTPEMNIGEQIDVFVYNDSEGRPVATTERPVATVGEFALMRVNAVNAVGAFLDWGLVAKELLVPFREQRVTMQAGRSYVVYVYLDDASQRIVATAKLDKHLDNTPPRYYRRQKVDLLVVQRTELGYKVIVDNRHWGLVYQKETYRELNVGERHTGFVQKVRDDGKIDVTVEKIERLRVDDLQQRILDHLKSHGGTMALNDRSTPDEIMATFSCSKKDFKKALGGLYKKQLIALSPAVKLL